MSDRIQPLSVGRRGRQRLLAAVAAVLLFGLGISIGIRIGSTTARQDLVESLRPTLSIDQRVLSRLTQVLRLTDSQTAPVGEIVRRYHDRVAELRAQTLPQMTSEFDLMQRDVAALLDDSQRERWQQQSEFIRRRFLPADVRKE